jgi:hypothetical protein
MRKLTVYSEKRIGCVLHGDLNCDLHGEATRLPCRTSSLPLSDDQAVIAIQVPQSQSPCKSELRKFPN